MADVNMIVAAGTDGAIGREGGLIWRISSDLRRFKALTTGHPVIMGRKTWDSLPRKPLPGRLNIVVTRNMEFIAPGAEVVNSPEEALGLCGEESPFVMGGEQIYRLFMPYVSRIFLTEVMAECPDADARLDLDPDSGLWQTIDKSAEETTAEGVTYRYVTLKRR